MNKRIAITSILATIAAFVATGQSQAQQYGVDYRQVGQWDVETVIDNNKLLGCRANTRTPTGVIGLLQYQTGNWVITMPDMNFQPGTKLSGMLSIGRASMPVNMTAGIPGKREAIRVDAAIMNGLRQGGQMNLEIGGRSFHWQMNDASAAMGTVQDCRNAAMRNGLPLRPGSRPQPVNAGNPGRAAAQYLGCFVDTPSRNLPVMLIPNGATMNSCISAAKRDGYSHIGLQDGRQCFGGGGTGPTKVADSQCNKRCVDGGVCGASWRNSVWKVN